MFFRLMGVLRKKNLDLVTLRIMGVEGTLNY